jgi:hypothetical protein
MSKDSIGDHLWAEMSEAQKVEAVLKNQATLKQISEGLLDGSERLRSVCQEFLSHTGSSFENVPVEVDPPEVPADSVTELAHHRTIAELYRSKTRSRTRASTARQRFGLPEGFVPRMQRFGRAVLLELNVYRLPDGQEFIPAHPSGTLGARRHLYALLTPEQYLKGKRGSVYVRNDGRIFDYSVDSANPSGDIFDTGYTIYDLERTGQYAPVPRRRRKKSQPAKYHRAAAGR